MSDAKFTAIPLLAAAALTYLATAALAEPPKDGTVSAPAPKSPGLIGVLRAASKKTTPGSRLQLTYEVRNSSKAPVTLRFSSGQRCEITATNPTTGTQVWNSSEGKFYNMMVSGAIWKPGETKRFSETWTIPADTKPGRYKLGAYLTVMGSKTANTTKPQPYLAETVVEIASASAPTH